MEPSKVKAVTEWTVPDSQKQLQRFLGFANPYRRFIRNYSSMAAPLTALTNSKTPFTWPKEAAVAVAVAEGESPHRYYPPNA